MGAGMDGQTDGWTGCLRGVLIGGIVAVTAALVHSQGGWWMAGISSAI